MKKRNIKVIVAYDGTCFFGWQIQPACRTVQGVMEEKLSYIVGEDIRLSAAGRTDRGVHASGQVANFFTGSGIGIDNLKVALNMMLPGDIFIREIDEVSSDFHARYSAIHRTYQYRLGLWGEPRSPFSGRYCWYPDKHLDFCRIERATRHLLGRRDFRALAKRSDLKDNTYCEVEEAVWHRIPDGFALEVTANRFLPQMIRRIIAALVDIGTIKREPELLEGILSGRKEDWPQPWVAPPQGLFLESVSY